MLGRKYLVFYDVHTHTMLYINSIYLAKYVLNRKRKAQIEYPLKMKLIHFTNELRILGPTTPEPRTNICCAAPKGDFSIFVKG